MTSQSMAPLELHADVVIVGGGLAGTWAALAAARQGGVVVLAEKGYCGTSGVTATAGVGHWWVPPDRQARAEALRERQARAFGLGEESWMSRILSQTWELLPTIGGAFRFPTDDDGVTQYRTVRGPEYLRAMRRLVKRAGVRILDQSPVLELLVHVDGSVAGVRGVQRQAGVDYQVNAGAVVLSTGGCGFASRLLGSQNNTGDGYLMAVEAGAELSGMEFSSYYTLSPAWSTMTRSMSYLFGTYFDADGNEIISDGPLRPEILARAMLAGPVYTRLDRAPERIQRQMPRVQPNFMLPFDRKGINPYTDLFEVTLRCEGTIRGTGGLRIVDDDCSTTVPGLFAAGDAATRELVAGATSGGGAQNSAWALSSGTWAGQAAVAYARRAVRGTGTPAVAAGGVGLRPRREARPVDTRAVVAAVQAEMHPYDKNMFRSADRLRASLSELDAAWDEVSGHLRATGVDAIRAREAAALVASARWSYTAALAREESRGMHQREDTPATDDSFTHRILVGGLDRIWISPERGSGSTDLADLADATEGIAS